MIRGPSLFFIQKVPVSFCLIFRWTGLFFTCYYWTRKHGACPSSIHPRPSATSLHLLPFVFVNQRKIPPECSRSSDLPLFMVNIVPFGTNQTNNLVFPLARYSFTLSEKWGKFGLGITFLEIHLSKPVSFTDHMYYLMWTKFRNIFSMMLRCGAAWILQQNVDGWALQWCFKEAYGVTTRPRKQKQPY